MLLRGGRNLLRSFVGPAGADPAAVVAGPGLALGPASRVPDRFWEYLAEGKGRSPDTGTCRVVVSRQRHGETLLRDAGLSPVEVDGWYVGSLDLLEIFVDCERDHGGRW